tara:strand:+ start:218 stop:412 length:195 start_codon:yes stop_codon:yes gene_type:complete
MAEMSGGDVGPEETCGADDTCGRGGARGAGAGKLGADDTCGRGGEVGSEKKGEVAPASLALDKR